MKWILPLLLSAGIASAADCPPAADYSAELLQVIEEARAAPSQSAGRAASGKMWEIWLRAPDEAAQEVLDRGMERRRQADYLGASKDFDALVEYCPDYAEGYNQRAFVNYLTQNYEAALVDLDRTLELVPNHVGAQSGRALTLMKMRRLSEARTQMLEALENNPWLGERALVADGGPLGPQGEDI